VAGVGKSPVADLSCCYVVGCAGCSGDRSGTGEGPQSRGRREPGWVVADLSENSCPENGTAEGLVVTLTCPVDFLSGLTVHPHTVWRPYLRQV
jgi:hypothetical protein